MWYDDLGVVSIGTQCGGPEDGGLGDMKVVLWKALRETRQQTYCPGINHYALLLNVDGQFQKFGPELVGKVRRNKKGKYIRAEIVIGENTWRHNSVGKLRCILANRVREAILLCIARLRKDNESINDKALLAEIDAAISKFLSEGAFENN